MTELTPKQARAASLRAMQQRAIVEYDAAMHAVYNASEDGKRCCTIKYGSDALLVTLNVKGWKAFRVGNDILIQW